MTRAILDYGCKGIEPKFEDPMLSAVFDGMIRGAIDKSQQHYQEKVTYGQTTGRKKIVDNAAIGQLAAQGMKAKMIADQLGISVAAVYHSEGWTNSRPKKTSVIPVENDGGSSRTWDF